MGATINGRGNGGASAPSGDGVATVVSGAFVSPVPSAATTRTTLGLGSLATASSVTASQVSDSTLAGRALLTAADAPAQRTALGLTSTATASTGTTSGSIAAGNDARLIPVALAGGFTDSANRFSRTQPIPAADLNFDTGMTLLVAGYRNATVSSAHERVIINLFNAGGTDGWQLTVNANTLKFLMIGASIAGGAASAAGSLGISLAATNAPFALAIQMLAGSIRTSLNGGTVAVATRSGGTTASAASGLGIGADRTAAANQAFNIGELGEIHLINRAFGDADLQAYSLAASTAYSYWPSMTATDRAAAKFSWSAVDGVALRAGQGPLAQTGFLARRMPL